MQEFLKTHADFSVDPCDDFYSHVCPAHKNRDFFSQLLETRTEIYNKNRNMFLGEEDVSPARAKEISQYIEKFLNSDRALAYCTNNKYPFNELFTKLTNNTYEISCEQHLEIMRKLGIEFFRKSVEVPFKIFFETIIYKELKGADKKAQNLFAELKSAVRNEFIKTPWARNKKVARKFMKHLKTLRLVTMADYESGNVVDLNHYKWLVDNLPTRLTDSGVDKNTYQALNSFFSLLLAETQLMKIPEVFPGDQQLSEAFYFAFHEKYTPFSIDLNDADNVTQSVVGFPNLLLLALNSDYNSDVYGGVGVILLHEIMHSFVFHDKDESMLKPFWTNSTDCVGKQMQKTCATFPTHECANSSHTFEEDAADMAAYRIAWTVYQKKLRRKSSGKKYEDLDKKELFFYAFPTSFCHPWEHNPADPDVHSSMQHRVNSVMSQMNEFAEIFKCKAEDRMVRNKAEHCAIYGRTAPQYKIFKGDVK